MKTLAITILIFFSISYSNQKNPSVASVDVQSPSGPELKNLSEIATDIQYIPLETNPKALMKYINDFKASGDKFYINTMRELLCFDKTGKFLYKLNQEGRGPNEYLYLSDYDINPGKKQIMVLTRGKLLFYNEADTGFQYSKQLNLKLQPGYCDYIPNQDNILLSFTAATGENRYQSVGISPKGDTLFKRPNYYRFTRNTKVQMGFRIDNVINRNKDMLSIKGFLTDTIFTITNDHKFLPGLILNTRGKGYTTDFLANIPQSELSSGGSSIKFLNFSGILDLDRYLLYKYYIEKTSYWGVYDKISKESRQFDVKDLLKDDISGGINIEPKFACNGMLYSWTDALTFKKFMSASASQQKGLKNPKRAAELQKISASIKEDDNHILIAITPKK